MVEAQILASGVIQGRCGLPDSVFNQTLNESVIHQLVVAYLAAGRSGTKAQKSRADVSGGGAKPWKQKGSGQARAGTTRSPLWRTGGVTFAADNRNFTQKLNKKMYRAGIRSIFSELLRQERLFVSDELNVATPKTKELKEKLNGNWRIGNLLIITDVIDQNLFLSARNMPGVDVCSVASINPVSLVGSTQVVLTKLAITLIEERWG